MPIKVIQHDPDNHKLTLTSTTSPTKRAASYTVRVHAFGITKGELQWEEPCSLKKNAVPGYDVAGTIEDVPADPDKAPPKFQPGTRVYALTAFERAGNAREFTIVEESEMALMPKNVFWREAAAVPMSALTAWQALFIHGGLKAEEATGRKRTRANDNALKRVLIIGASGSVGFWALQLAKWAGIAHVVGVCGTDNVEFVRGFGADEVIDYRKNNMGAWLRFGDYESGKVHDSKKKGKKSRVKVEQDVKEEDDIEEEDDVKEEEDVKQEDDVNQIDEVEDEADVKVEEDEKGVPVGPAVGGAGNSTLARKSVKEEERKHSPEKSEVKAEENKEIDEESKFDLVIDGVGGTALREAWTTVKKGGLLLGIAEEVEGTKPKTGLSENVRGKFFIVKPDGSQLQRITEMIEQKKVRPIMDSAWDFEEYDRAFDRVGSGHAQGKVVIHGPGMGPIGSSTSGKRKRDHGDEGEQDGKKPKIEEGAQQLPILSGGAGIC
ncbi:alcohol dehydrogenase [Venturia nashicola]|nr:alcohol dehydrogenase [Venturia nashicola]